MKDIVNLNPAIDYGHFFWANAAWDDSLFSALSQARGVILPQTVNRELYFLCKKLCTNCFPNYDIRFKWEGKVGDALLFKTFSVPHPKTIIFPCLEALNKDHIYISKVQDIPPYPFVLKSSSGGEGMGTWLITSEEKFREILKIIEHLEWQGKKGFIIQEIIPDQNRDLRVVVIGKQILSYWRYADSNFYHNVARGGKIDKEADPELQAIGREAVSKLCKETDINLAAFDLLFRENTPLFLEINYTFGRKGLGGTEGFYRLLKRTISEWEEAI